MKLLLLLLLYPAMVVSPKTEKYEPYNDFNLKKRNVFVNILMNRFIGIIRHIITHGSAVMNIPPLDPFELKDFHIIIPTGLFNLDLLLKNVSVTGIGGFKMHRNNLHLSNLTLEIEISIPRIIIIAEMIHLSEVDNDFTIAIPIYTRDKTELDMDNFRFQAIMVLKQSEDEKSILIDRIEDPIFDIPSCKIDGVIDGDNLQAFSDIQETFIDYVNGGKDVIAQIISNAIMTFVNPILNLLNSWHYIAILL